MHDADVPLFSTNWQKKTSFEVLNLYGRLTSFPNRHDLKEAYWYKTGKAHILPHFLADHSIDHMKTDAELMQNSGLL